MNTQHVKLASSTYIGKETSFITNLFIDTIIKVVFTPKNSFDKLLSKQNNVQQNK
jgi:hypothetical protein